MIGDLIKSVRIRVILEIDILQYKGFNGKLESNRRNEYAYNGNDTKRLFLKIWNIIRTFLETRFQMDKFQTNFIMNF